MCLGTDDEKLRMLCDEMNQCIDVFDRRDLNCCMPQSRYLAIDLKHGYECIFCVLAIPTLGVHEILGINDATSLKY